MTRWHFLLLLAPLAGCSATPVPALDQVAPTRPESYARAFSNDLLDFSFSYPAEAAAIPDLSARLLADEAAVLAEAMAAAANDWQSAQEGDRPFHQHYLHKNWTSAGQSKRLLALVAEIGTFTGGAHGNSGFTTILWDRREAREVPTRDLFESEAALDGLTRGAFCRALDAERLERRQGEKLEGQFAQCPGLDELTIIPLDQDANGRFDHVRFLAGPYVAGPYVEGAHQIDVPIRAALRGALKPAFAGSFEIQSAQ